MASTGLVRFSAGNVANSEDAKAFDWEDPVPVNKFWDSITYCVSRNFLGNFTDDELGQLPIDPNSAADNEEKYTLLLQLLKEKLENKEAAASPQELYVLDYKGWNRLVQGMYTYQDELGLPEAEQSLRLLVERAEENNVVPRHMLAEYLVKQGKFKEAEEAERPVCAWMDAHPRLGKDSPQAINARRIIVRALWGQGSSRRVVAEAMIAELKEIVDGMGDGQFGVYQSEERELTHKMMDQLV